MRNALWAACLSSTALLGAAAALAQTQPQITPERAPIGEVRGRAAIAQCDRLATYLTQSRPADAGITVEQVHEWRLAANSEACREHLERLTAAADQPIDIQPNPTPQTGSPLNAAAVGEQAPAAGSELVRSPETTSTQPANPPANAAAPAAPAEEGKAPRVLVQQVQPNVTVRQAQPEIIVRQAPPTITVQQPQPEIIVRMPEPDVNVSAVRPQVQVVMPQPQVQVLPPRQEAQANVEVQRQQPNVRYESTGEPRIVYQRAEGQPQIRFEPMGGQDRAPADAATAAAAPAAPQGQAPESLAAATPPADQSSGTTAASPDMTQQSAQAQLNRAPGYGTVQAQGAPQDTTRTAPGARPAEPQQTGALPEATAQPVAVEQLRDMALYNARDEKLGDVDDVFAGPDNKVFAVVKYGGFLGLGEKRVAVPLEQVALRGDRLVTEGMSDDQLRALPEFEDGSAGFRELDDGQTAPVRILR